MPNPVLNDRSLRAAASAEEVAPGWAAGPTPLETGPRTRPISDGPISPYRTARFTVAGAARVSGILFAVLLAGGIVGWRLVATTPEGQVSFPGWLLLPVLGAFALALVTVFKPMVARYTAPAYAVLEGLFLGAISHVYEAQWNGIVVQAVLGTAGVFAAMLFLYTQRIIRVTDRTRRMIIAATFGVMVIYLVGALVSLFGGGLSFINSPSGFGILFSFLVVGIAAFNLLLDFDVMERAERSAAPRQLEWFAAFGLMVTVVWLYLEILRLLAKLNGRRGAHRTRARSAPGPRSRVPLRPKRLAALRAARSRRRRAPTRPASVRPRRPRGRAASRPGTGAVATTGGRARRVRACKDRAPLSDTASTEGEAWPSTGSSSTRATS
jgi:uncharacterized YccA/Bax inhibitor family protein